MSFHPRRFDRAARSYGSLSQVQEDMAGRLMALVPDRETLLERKAVPPSGGRDGILEMGCGTGHLTRRLRRRFHGSPLLATDAAPRMLEEAAKAMDGEVAFEVAAFDVQGPEDRITKPVRAAMPFALAASNALVQWFPDLGAHFRLVAGLLAPGGGYLVSGFLRDNFPELNALLAEEPFGYRDFPGHGKDEVEQAAREAGFSVEAMETGSEEAVYPGARAFLEHIQGLGSARRPEAGRPMTRGRLGMLEERYQARFGGAGPDRTGVRATWKTWYALLRKRS